LFVLNKYQAFLSALHWRGTLSVIHVSTSGHWDVSPWSTSLQP